MMDVRDSWTDIFGLKLILDSAETTTIFARPSQSTPSVSCVVSEATPSSKSIGGEIEFRSSSQSCVGRNAKSVVEADFQKWIFVESLRRKRRRRRAVKPAWLCFLCFYLCPWQEGFGVPIPPSIRKLDFGKERCLEIRPFLICRLKIEWIFFHG